MEGVARVVDTRDLTTEWGGEGRGGAGSQRGAGRPVSLGLRRGGGDIWPLDLNWRGDSAAEHGRKGDITRSNTRKSSIN